MGLDRLSGDTLFSEPHAVALDFNSDLSPT